MRSKRLYSPLDRLLIQADTALRTLTPFSGAPTRSSPAIPLKDAELSDEERRHAAGLMRINHTGEVCAQALYQGQALTAKLPEVREEMERSADEEIDHLAWCEPCASSSLVSRSRCRQDPASGVSSFQGRMPWV